MVSIKNNLEQVWQAIGRAAQALGRQASDITLVAVTKQVRIEKILEAISCGVTEIGENRVQEAESKFNLIPRQVKRHLVGHLQTNKVKKTLEIFDMIQSLDSLRLAQQINHRCASQVMPVLVEVNTSGEATKSGLAPEETLEFLKKLEDFEKIQVRGLMTVGPLTGNQIAIRNSFRTLRRSFEEASRLNLVNCQMQYLSMGMSSDFEIAIQEGSNMVRIGTAIFGARN